MDKTDLFLFDLKHPDPIKHEEGTGKDNKLILENLRFLSEQGKAIEVRIPLIPHYNDTEENLRQSGDLLSQIKTLTKAVLLPYHDFAKTKYAALGIEDTMPQVSSPTDEDLHSVAEILRASGVNAVSGRE
jgi:pyruvate formate lyase activating enzyme